MGAEMRPVAVQALSPEAVRVLGGARQKLLRGWLQGASANKEKTAFCLVGALCQARLELFGERHPCYGEASQALSEAVGDAVLQFWNDAPGRTQEDVLQLIDSVLAKERK